ncbi:ead/Ea22-like family protein [Enterobacter cloacae]|uniref:ead/Ea22-like family protein n=1 Tax=Enterobacter cloacae TaxID=550 RepID=UPI0031D28500
MSNIGKQALRNLARRATPGPWAMEHENIWYYENGYTKHLAYFCQGDDVDDSQDDFNTRYVAAADPSTVLALLDELEAKDQRVAELSALQGKPIAWESTTPVYVKFITDERYQRLRPGYQKWYKPYRCSQCAAAGKGEAS